MRALHSMVLALAGLLIPMIAQANTYYVSTTGSDGNPGTLTQPWRTIQKACNMLTPGDTVQIRAGTYAEKVQVNVSGSAGGGWVTIENYPGEHVIVNAYGLHSRSEIQSIGSDNVFLIQDKNYIQISGLEIENNSTSGDPTYVDGSLIRIYGSGDHIAILGNTLHHTRGHDSMAITVYGTEANTPVSNLSIDNNLIYDCTPAHSETLTLNGNVENFDITGNTLHNVNNIGIDMIGGDTSIGPPNGPNATRFGVCQWNTVSYCHSSYDDAAAGIYVDGGHDIVINNNTSFFNDEGLEVGAEIHGVTAYNVTVRDNMIYRNTVYGIVFGGYDANSTGSVQNCQFLNNTCYQNDTHSNGNGEMAVQYHASNNVIRNNLFCATRQNLLISWDPNNTASTNNALDYNLYYCPGGAGNAQFGWEDHAYTGYASYLAGTGQDPHSLFANPLFAAPATYNLHLTANSPAVNRGDPNFVPATGEVDIDGDPRVMGGRVDIGMDEY
ncbi:MAG TPA: right-handed parallel beta-helix repeat-containing protein [Chthonomonadaceae bacterium]|nr:right-handed parallel beta-helix repeat-containing protein [Chthonomonadaceae bacterium]